ncbi:MAG TPA: NADH-quinone oxidoreductase subunit NuoF [Thermoanaerobaculales bacterium]|nr:NADH-quinone oxidoreductase subunit NuoF [Thermoanaerobaculales bacterium]
MEPILLRARGTKDSRSIAAYRAAGGYRAIAKALAMEPSAVIAEVRSAGLRGRGGAGFPTGVKWGFVPKDSPKAKYLICNADESEPGTFKDREIIHVDPHMVIEGIVIASHAIGANAAYIYIRGEFHAEALMLQAAIDEAAAAGMIGHDILGSGFSLEVHVHRGAGAYICGEETALIESLEGKRGLPRLKPPFPAVVGLFGCPTVVNNVETLACVPHIIERGAAWFAAIGTERSKGPKLFSVSGHVNRPGVYELPMGTPFREIIYEVCGGIRGGRALKAFIPGGSSCPVLPADKVDVGSDFESVAAAGSMLGSGGLIVMDDTVDMVWALDNILTFYAHESCGQCTPCREGSDWALDVVRRIRRGFGRPEDIETLERIARYASQGMTICPFGDAFSEPIKSFLKHFGHEFSAAIATARPLPDPKTPVLPLHSGSGWHGNY